MSMGQMSGEVLEVEYLIKDLIKRLYTYEPNETKTSFMGDYTLIGLIDLITIIFESDPKIL